MPRRPIARNSERTPPPAPAVMHRNRTSHLTSRNLPSPHRPRRNPNRYPTLHPHPRLHPGSPCPSASSSPFPPHRRPHRRADHTRPDSETRRTRVRLLARGSEVRERWAKSREGTAMTSKATTSRSSCRLFIASTAPDPHLREQADEGRSRPTSRTRCGGLPMVERGWRPLRDAAVAFRTPARPRDPISAPPRPRSARNCLQAVSGPREQTYPGP